MNLAKFIDDTLHQHFSSRVFYAEISGVTGNQVSIIRLGQTTIEGPYPRLASYSAPAAPDLVMCIQVGGSIVVIGEVLT